MIAEIVLIVILIAAIGYDLREHRMPNWVTLPGLAAGVVLQVAQGGGSGLFTGLAGAAAGAGLLIIPFALRWVGGGDLKLVAAVGSLMGIPFTLSTLLIATVAGGVIAAGWLLTRSSLVSSLKYLFLVWLPMAGPKPEALKTRIPFGPAVGLGALTAMFWR